MHVLNHGSRCPTSGAASARYTRGSTDDGPGVSINRQGGLSSPTRCVIFFFLLFLALLCRNCLRVHASDYARKRCANHNFRPNAIAAATDNLAPTMRSEERRVG